MDLDAVQLNRQGGCGATFWLTCRSAWTEAADLILKSLNGAIGSNKVTCDFARLVEGATEIKCSAFGDNIITHM